MKTTKWTFNRSLQHSLDFVLLFLIRSNSSFCFWIKSNTIIILTASKWANQLSTLREPQTAKSTRNWLSTLSPHRHFMILLRNYFHSTRCKGIRWNNSDTESDFFSEPLTWQKLILNCAAELPEIKVHKKGPKRSDHFAFSSHVYLFFFHHHSNTTDISPSVF